MEAEAQMSVQMGVNYTKVQSHTTAESGSVKNEC